MKEELKNIIDNLEEALDEAYEVNNDLSELIVKASKFVRQIEEKSS